MRRRLKHVIQLVVEEYVYSAVVIGSRVMG